MSNIEFNAFLRSILSQELRSEKQSASPLISIWGTLEARVQSKDLVILGGLNEDTWPTKSSHDMWLNRDMRKQLSLLLPERRIGLSAHDFQQAISASNVVLSRSLRDGDTPSTPSRWIIRITNLMEGLKSEGPAALSNMRNRGNYWLALARNLDKIEISDNEYCFHAGTTKKENKIYASGGRVLNFVCTSESFSDARKKIISTINSLNWNSGFYRKDIGYKVIDE
jgi:inactivated superfamily I helicase